ncbi:MFS-type Sugar/inositol transporter [Penicillium ucsense]|uniref:MFS-type Sugar/inositol transporter n=1 Tax=Penicillium ucsense TaxID=2839758 RepID=A0A8J8W9F5_9EURO|nr:MFS-type Sugar/inositol transporter [Penicillium ucsense]KAF7734138.1 MFS-type Sugar/inositol transporter [Penicillium ucsense]
MPTTRFFGLRGTRLNVVTIIGVLMPAILSVGYNATSLGGVLSLRSFETQFREIDLDDASDKDHAAAIQGTVVAVYPIGGFLGTFICVWLGDFLGRRRTIMSGALVQIIGAVLNASAFCLAQLVASRLVAGLGTGMLLATVPLWQSEIAPASKRGSHVATKGIFSGLGCAITLFLEYGFSLRDGKMAWRFPAAFPIIFSLAVLGFIIFLPDSPRWLIQRGRITEARDTLAALEDLSPDDKEIDNRIEDMQASFNRSGNQKTLAQLFTMGPQRTSHRAFLAMTVMIFLQLTGATVTQFYTTAIFENNLGLQESTSRLLAAVYQLMGPVGGILCVLTIERLGRRALLMSSAAGNAICLSLIAALGSMNGNLMAAHGAVFFIFLFHFSYIIGFGSIPYLYASEIAPMNLRATISSVSISISWAISILVANVTPIAFNEMGQRYFFFFAGFNIFMIPAVFYFFPETSGRTLEEIDEIFTCARGLFDAVSIAKKLPTRVRLEILTPEKGMLVNEKSLDSPLESPI